MNKIIVILISLFLYYSSFAASKTDKDGWEKPEKSFVKLLHTYGGMKKGIKVKLIAPNDIEYMKKLIVSKKGTKVYFYGTIDDMILGYNRVCTVTVNLGQTIEPNGENN